MRLTNRPFDLNLLGLGYITTNAAAQGRPPQDLESYGIGTNKV